MAPEEHDKYQDKYHSPSNAMHKHRSHPSERDQDAKNSLLS